MNTRITNSKLFKRLKEKRFRDTFVAGEIRRLLPFQLRALRAAREWTQGELGERANMPQTVISRIENGNAASLSIKTLLKLAAAFDVALVIRFEPIDRLVNWVDGLSADAMAPRPSAELITEAENAFAEPRATAIAARRTATPVSHLRVLDSPAITTTALQRSLAFSSPAALVVESGRATTANQPMRVTETTASAYRATA